MKAAMTRRVLKKIISVLMVAVVALTYWGVSASQAFAQNCSVTYEAIMPLREPDIGAFNVWSGVHGEEDSREQYVDGAMLPNSHIFLAGEVSGPNGDNLELVLSEVDRRGRIVWQQFHPIPSLESVVKVLRHKDHYIVLGNKNDAKRGKSIWIGFFDEKGNFKSERIHRHQSRGSVHAYDMIVTPKGGFLMAVSVKANAKDTRGFSSFYRLNSKAQFIAKRSYIFGSGNRILGLAYTQDGNVIASGFMQQKGERRMGWLMKLESDGGLIWQRQYPRGRHAELTTVQPYGPKSILAVGTSDPAGGGGKAGWVMVVDEASGNITWQRYFTGDYNYVARDVLVNDDGLMSVVLDGDPLQSEGGKDFVRLLTLNPRGVVLDSREFFNGQGADAYSIVEGNSGERILIGATDMAYTIEGSDTQSEVQLKKSREGWVLAAPAPSSYSDPCL